jgi:hypothetical protein
MRARGGRGPSGAPMNVPRRRLLAAALLLAGGAQGQAGVPSEVVAALPGARLQGAGLLRFLGLRVYDIRLWTGAIAVGADWAQAAATPLALEIEYARALEGAQIAERTLKEMRRQAEIAAEVGVRWLVAMKQLLPDVRAGDRITGVHLPGEGARFFVNGRLQGDLRDADFARLFFGIWLSPRTSEPALREALLGLDSR